MVYEIWYITERTSLPMVEILDIYGLYRDDVRSKDLAKLEATLEHLEMVSPSDVGYEIRPALVESPF